MGLLLAAAAATWVVTEYKDPINDRMQYTASMEYGGIGLHVICVPKDKRNRAKSFVEVSTQRHLGFDGTAVVHFRFDERKADFGLWRFEGKSVSTDLPDPFLAELRTARKLTLRIVDSRREAYDLIFHLPDDLSPVNQVNSHCP